MMKCARSTRKRKMRKINKFEYSQAKAILYTRVLLLIFILAQAVACFELCKQNKQLKSKNHETIIVERDISPIPYKELGEYTISFYCDCPICTKTVKGSKTATGTKPKEGTTIACDGNILKMGDIVYIESVGVRICEDKGSSITKGRIDVYMDDHDIASKMGIRKVNVYRIGG